MQWLKKYHLSVNSCYKNFHHRYAYRFDLILLITMLTFSPLAIPQMSDIHILIHFTGFKGAEKYFFDDYQGWIKDSKFWGFWTSLNYSTCAYSRLNSSMRADMKSRDRGKHELQLIPQCCSPRGRCSSAFQWEADKVIIRKGLREKGLRERQRERESQYQTEREKRGERNNRFQLNSLLSLILFELAANFACLRRPTPLSQKKPSTSDI